jgi:cellulose biosynthesis protein BcsQ
MKITVYNYKGGVGKTRIALNLALTLELAIITNEIYIPTIKKIIPDENYMQLAKDQDVEIYPEEFDIIFDFGGGVDQRITNAIKQSDWVVVPVTNDHDELEATINIIQEIEDINKKIVVVANRTAKGDYEAIKKAVSKHYPYNVFEIKKSKGLKNITKEGKSIKAMVEEGGLKAYSYKALNQQFDELIKFLKKHEKVKRGKIGK